MSLSAMFGYGSPRSGTPIRRSQADVSVPSDGKPLRLVSQDSAGRFVMDPEAVSALKKVKGPMAVVSVCGRARQGKSFILNQLLGRSNGFMVGPTHRPCTKGLWMWSVPVKRVNADGSSYHLLLLDSEGIEAYDQTGQYSTQIFSLAVLLSSLFVFNQMGGIDEAALDNLALVTEMTKHIRVKSDMDSPEDLGSFSPSFLWLLRDFYLDLSEDGKPISPKDYLEQALNPMGGSSKAVLAKNDIRKSIRALFPDRDCFALVRPLNNEKDLQRLDQIPVGSLRPEFLAGLDRLTRLVFEKAKPKRMGSAFLTGPILAALTQSYLDALNKGAVPSIATSWQSVEEQQCRAAMEQGLQTYKTEFESLRSFDEVAVRERHRAATSAAVERFEAEAIGTGAVRSDYARQMTTSIQTHFEEHWKRVSAESELRCEQKQSEMSARMNAYVAQAEGATWQEGVQRLEGLLAEYVGAAQGPAKWPKMIDFVMDSVKGPLTALVKKQAQGTERQNAELARQLAVAQAGLAEARERLAEGRKDLDSWRARAQAAGTKEAELAKRAEQLERQLAVLEARGKAREQEGAQMLEKIRSLESSATSLQSGAQKERAELAAALQTAQREARARQVEAQDWSRKYEAAVKGHAQGRAMADAEREAERREAEERHRAELRRKEAALEELRKVHAEDVQKVVQVQADSQDKHAEVASVKAALAASRAEIQHLHARATSAEARATSAESSLTAAQSSLQQQSSETASFLSKVAEWERAAEAAEARARQAEEVCERLTQRAQLAEAAVLERDSKLAALGEEMDVNLDRAGVQVQASQAEAAEVLRREAELEQANAALAGQLAAANAELSAATAELASAKSQLEEYSQKRARTDVKESKKRSREEAMEEEAFQEASGDGFGAEHAEASQKVREPNSYTKQELKEMITLAGFAHLFLSLRNPSKAQLVEIYRKNVP